MKAAPDMKVVKAIEKYHPFKMTAGCDDGSAFFITVGKDGAALGTPFLLTPKKMKALAAVRL